MARTCVGFGPNFDEKDWQKRMSGRRASDAGKTFLKSSGGAAALILIGSLAGGAAERPRQAVFPRRGTRRWRRPFIEHHCLGCHGEKKAKAGFRIDLLGADFAAARVADHWKEVIDRINAGEMPPEGSPRPDAKQARRSSAGSTSNCARSSARRRTPAGASRCGGSTATSTPTPCATC